MITKGEIKRLSDLELGRFIEAYTEIHDINERRMAALARKKERDPRWSFVPPEGDEPTSIDEVIEIIGAHAEYNDEQLKNFHLDVERRQGYNQTITMF